MTGEKAPVERPVIHWVTLHFANGVVNNWHSHLPPTRGHVFALGAFVGPECVGVVIAGRPVARGLDDGMTLDVTRLATNGHPNAASALLGRARRVAAVLGFRKCVSYTLASEAGTSYRAAGWQEAARIAPQSWNNNVRKGRADIVAGQEKIRWEIAL